MLNLSMQLKTMLILSHNGINNVEMSTMCMFKRYAILWICVLLLFLLCNRKACTRYLSSEQYSTLGLQSEESYHICTRWFWGWRGSRLMVLSSYLYVSRFESVIRSRFNCLPLMNNITSGVTSGRSNLWLGLDRHISTFMRLLCIYTSYWTLNVLLISIVESCHQFRNVSTVLLVVTVVCCVPPRCVVCPIRLLPSL